MSVCVIVPNLNYGRYLCRALSSVRRQTVPVDDLIVVDGGSTDDSRKAADYWGARWIEAPPRGMANARNVGIAATTADYIIPLDADDWIEPTYVARCLPRMAPGVGIVAPGLRWPDGRVQYPKEPITRETLLRENRLFTCSMFRRECWEAVSGYDEYRRTYEDWDLWLRIVKAGWRVAVVAEPLFRYCPHVGSSTGRMKPGDHEEYARHIRSAHA